LNVDLPASFEVSKQEVVQGDTIRVYLNNVNPDEKPYIRQTLYPKSKLYWEGSTYVMIIPTGYRTSPGKYDIEYGLEGSETRKTTVIVKERNFHIQYLQVDENVESSTRNDAAYAEFNKYFVPVRQASTDQLYYKDMFVVPAKGRLSTEFGETRHVNGSPTSYRHSGLDIAAPTGAPVYAVNRGKVVLSRFFTLTGNTIVIDHGRGLFSVYYHLDKRLMEQDIMVEKGQQIGEVGTTGFSTGPHLHFTMSYYDTNIEPGYFIAGKPITYDNYKQYLE
jgi:murein DD-endopeptidase MepM/ murein hydrolase activator NlpD